MTDTNENVSSQEEEDDPSQTQATFDPPSGIETDEVCVCVLYNQYCACLGVLGLIAVPFGNHSAGGSLDRCSGLPCMPACRLQKINVHVNIAQLSSQCKQHCVL